jgi:hypothetical protein
MISSYEEGSIPKANQEHHRMLLRICILLVFLSLDLPLKALTDFLTDNPKIQISFDESKLAELSAEDRNKVLNAPRLIQDYAADWQQRFGRLRRHLKIRLVPTQQQISLSGARAEGVWAWNSFNSEEGTVVVGIVGDLYINLNSTQIPYEVLVAHEASHAFLITYFPKLLESGNDFRTYNEGLAELFAIQYDPKPWRAWDEMLLSRRRGTSFETASLSVFARRTLNVLNGKAILPHDYGFFYLYVVRDSKTNLDQDLKDCTNKKIIEEIRSWLKKHPDQFDLPMIQ